MHAIGRCLRLAMIAIIAAMVAVMQSAPVGAAAPPLSVYGKLPGIERVAMSPSGDLVAVIGLVEETRRLVILNQDRKPLITVPLGDAKIRGVYWAGEDRVLVFKSDTNKLSADFYSDKAEFFTMIVIPINGDKMWSVFEHDERITGGINGFYGIQTRDGRSYGYFGAFTFKGDFRSPDGYLTSGSPVLYEVDLKTGQSKAIGPRLEGGSRDWVMGPDGQIGAILDFTSGGGDWVIRNGAGQKIGEGVNPSGRVGLIGLGATPDTVIVSEQVESANPRWFEVPLAGGDRTEILADAGIDNAYFDERTRRLVGYQQDDSYHGYHFFDSYRQKVINATMKAFPGVLVTLEAWNDRFDRLVVMTEGVGDPQTWWTIDIKTGNATELGFSYPIAAAEVGPMQTVQYQAGDGQAIEAILTLPPGRAAKKLPVIILPHGGPAARDYPGFDYWAQAFASRGYAVLQPNFRGSTGYGVAFQRAGHGQWGRTMQSDISDGLAYLVGRGIADPKRACIMGASYGGYAALAGVTLQQGLYRCAVAVAGVSDVAKLASGYVRKSGYDRTMKRAIEEEIGANRDLRPISPINFADRADAPVLLIHGKDDIVVPYEQSDNMAAALRRAGKPVELATLPGEDHWLSRSETRLAMLEAAMRFVEAHNPPGPAP